jgi:hypothetical protein
MDTMDGENSYAARTEMGSDDTLCEPHTSDEDMRNMAARTADKLDSVRREMGRIVDVLRRLGR